MNASVLRVRAHAPIRPTEDPAKVRAAIEALFPGASVELSATEARAEGLALDRIRELVRSQRIPDTARGVMLSGLSDDGLHARFKLGKQAAAAGRAHFGAIREPLGELVVELESDAPGEVERTLYHVAPDTTVPIDLAEVPPSLRPQS